MSKKFTLTIEVNELVAVRLLDVESACFWESKRGLPTEIITAVKDFFPEIAVKYSHIWDDKR